MKDKLSEIQAEYERRHKTSSNQDGVELCKKLMILGVHGAEAVANYAVPHTWLDLRGWNADVAYSMEISPKEWNNVILELLEKYSFDGSVAPELRLMFMICYSGLMYSNKKLEMNKLNREYNDVPLSKEYQSDPNGNNTDTQIPDFTESENNDEDLEIRNILEQMKNNEHGNSETEEQVQSITVDSVPKRKRGRPKKNNVVLR
jgi:hypothetical protein